MITDYRAMAADSARVRQFQKGITKAVRPGDVVIEIGTGLGTYAIFACRAGAKKVYAIERDSVIHVARKIAKDNGCADRIEFIYSDAFEAKLPQKADVVIIEDFSRNFLEPETESILRLARKFLKRNGRMLPSCVELFAAPISSPTLFKKIDIWGEDQTAYGIDFSATREMAFNSLHRAYLKPRHQISQAKRVNSIDLLAFDSFDFESSVNFTAKRAGLIHGLAIWFDAALAPGVRLSNSPAAMPTLWGQGFLPLAEPVRVDRGDRIRANLRVCKNSLGDRFWWQWSVSTRLGQCDGSTFNSMPLCVEELAAGSRDRRPGLSADAEITAYVLPMLKKSYRIIDVAHALKRRFPQSFRSLESALARAGADARKFGKLPDLRGGL